MPLVISLWNFQRATQILQSSIRSVKWTICDTFSAPVVVNLKYLSPYRMITYVKGSSMRRETERDRGLSSSRGSLSVDLQPGLAEAVKEILDASS